MAQIDLSPYSYFPCLQSTEAEHLGYRRLSNEDKRQIVPVFEISQLRNEARFEDSINMIIESAEGRPFIIDLSKDPAPPVYVPRDGGDPSRIAQAQAAQAAYNSAMTALLAPADGFSAWRTLLARFPQAIPVLQYTDPATQSHAILRQAARLSNGGSDNIAIRIHRQTPVEILQVIAQIIAILESSEKLLIIIDCGQGRQEVVARADFVRQSVGRIIAGIEPAQAPSVNVVCMSDFFTNPPNDPHARRYENGAWELWSQACDSIPLKFGDYGAHYRLKKASTFVPPDWKAKVVFPLDEAWLVYQEPNAQDAEGWLRGAAEIVGSEELGYDGVPACWGGQILLDASQGSIEGVQSPRFWEAGKVNMHIHRQILFAPRRINAG